MPAHDIIDNRSEKLADTINQYLGSSRSAKFAVGYFFLSGFEAIRERLGDLDEVRLLIGPTSNLQTIEQLVLSHKRLELAEDGHRRIVHARRDAQTERLRQTSSNVRETLELQDQTDEAQEFVVTLARLIEEGRLKVKVYAKSRLHAKCYIFDERDPERRDRGVAIVGSSNLSIAGIESATELNVVVHGNDNHARLTAWFDELWDEAQDFDEALLREIRQSWAANTEVTPYDIYIKTLYNLFRGQLEVEAEPVEILDERWPVLADFQEAAYKWAGAILEKFGGVFVADVVGLGKSYIGLALLKHLAETGNYRPLIICPAGLVEMWERYCEAYEVNARVLSMGMLKEREQDGRTVSELSDFRYRDRDLVLIDESQNFRYSNSQRYRVLRDYLHQQGRKCILLTATPRATSAEDLYNQIGLWLQDTRSLPVDPPDLREYFNAVRDGARLLPELLRHILIRRTRRDIKRMYPDAKIAGEPVRFPKRELQPPVRYRIDDTYRGVYDQIRGIIDPQSRQRLGITVKPEEVLSRVREARERSGEAPLGPAEEGALKKHVEAGMCYARYGLFSFVLEDCRRREPYVRLSTAGRNLRGLMRIMLFKRLESSVEAFRSTASRLANVHALFLEAMDHGRIPAGEDAQRLLYETDMEDLAISELLSDLAKIERDTGRTYDIAAFDAQALREGIKQDKALLHALYDLVRDIGPSEDAKLCRLQELLDSDALRGEKALVFSQYEDTVRYLYANLKDRPQVAWASSETDNLSRVVARFAPKANPELARQYQSRNPIELLIATDVLSEGLNLQDASVAINYDLHFNPVRLIQRVGRIDRIGSEHDRISAYNFFPETEIERNLGLEQRARRRAQDIHDTIGEDGPIVHPGEQLNEKAFYAIYTGDASVIEEEDDEYVRTSLADAEELIRRLVRERPDYIEHIRELPDGVRSARKAKGRPGFFVYCAAEAYEQLHLADEEGTVVSRDLREVVDAIACDQDEPTEALPANVNQAVMAVKRRFDHEAGQRASEQRHSPRMKVGQSYVLRELRVYYGEVADGTMKNQIGELERAFRQRPSQAVNRILNRLRRDGVRGQALFDRLRRLCHDHALQAMLDLDLPGEEQREPTRIVCGEALL